MANIKELDPKDLIDKDIFSLLGVEDASNEEKSKILQDMVDTIQNRVIARVMDSLDEGEKEYFMKLMEEGNDTKVKDYLGEKSIDLAKISAEESLMYKMQVLNLLNA